MIFEILDVLLTAFNCQFKGDFCHTVNRTWVAVSLLDIALGGNRGCESVVG